MGRAPPPTFWSTHFPCSSLPSKMPATKKQKTNHGESSSDGGADPFAAWFSANPADQNLDKDMENITAFVERQKEKGRKVILVTVSNDLFVSVVGSSLTFVLHAVGSFIRVVGRHDCSARKEHGPLHRQLFCRHTWSSLNGTFHFGRLRCRFLAPRPLASALLAALLPLSALLLGLYGQHRQGKH